MDVSRWHGSRIAARYATMILVILALFGLALGIASLLALTAVHSIV